MVTHDWQTVNDVAQTLSDGSCYLLFDDSTVCLINSPPLSFLMGRQTWSTPEQLKFLRSFTADLPKAKAGTGLNVLYADVAQKFLLNWKAEPIDPCTQPAATASELEEKALIRLHNVCFIFLPVFTPPADSWHTSVL